MPKQRLHVEGFRPLQRGEGGYSPTARRYVNTETGEVIGVGKFQRLAHAETTSPVSREGTHNRDLYNLRLSQYTEHVNAQARRDGTREITKAEARRQADFKTIYKWSKSKDRSAKGKKAQALVALGLREAEWDWDVGDTPDNY